jgi:hypothetical protein
MLELLVVAGSNFLRELVDCSRNHHNLLDILTHSSMSFTSLPSFKELPNFNEHPGCAWDVWGKGDQLGTVNLLTNEVVKRAASEEIK